MDEEKKQEEQENGTDQLLRENGRKHNWITDIYDKMNVSVRTLDILLVILCLLVVFLFVFGKQIGG